MYILEEFLIDQITASPWFCFSRNVFTNVRTAMGPELSAISSANLRAASLGSSQTCNNTIFVAYQFSLPHLIILIPTLKNKRIRTDTFLTSLTSPQRRASSAVMSFPVSNREAAVDGPTKLGRKWVAAMPIASVQNNSLYDILDGKLAS